MKKRSLIILLLLTLVFILTGCGTSIFEKMELTKNAINYFVEKYDIDEEDIVITKNYLYGKNEKCLDECTYNILYITHKDTKYHLYYDMFDDYYSDDYQCDQIYEAFYQYLNNRFDYASKIELIDFKYDVEKTAYKYDGDIKEYVKNIRKSIKYYSDGTVEGYSKIVISIEVNNEVDANEINQKYYKDFITELEELNLSYEVNIFQNNNGSKKYYYQYKMNILEKYS